MKKFNAWVAVTVLAGFLSLVSSQAPASPLGLLVSSFNTNDVKRFDGTTGAPFPAPDQTGANFTTGSAPFSPFGLAFGPDGNLYVGSGGPSGSVRRFDANTGKFIDVFTSGAPASFEPSGVVFGPDGNLYVSDYSVNSDFLDSMERPASSWASLPLRPVLPLLRPRASSLGQTVTSM